MRPTRRDSSFMAFSISRSRPIAAAFALACALAVLATGCHREPFPHVKVSGSVKYDDGSLIPAHSLEVMFNPQAAPKNKTTFPRIGHAEVDIATGAFTSVTTTQPNDGVVAGKHKVTLRAYLASGEISPAVPEEYGDVTKTPLEVDTAQPVFHLTVKKPSS